MNPRLKSDLMLIAIIGALVYLGVIDYILWRLVAFGHTTIYWDYVSPFEALVVVPFCSLMLFVSGVDHLRSLVKA